MEFKTEKLKKEMLSKKIKTGDVIVSFFGKVTKKEYENLPGHLKLNFPQGSVCRKYHNCTTGHQDFLLENVICNKDYSLYEKGNKKGLDGYYIEYDGKDDCLYIILAKILFTKCVEGEIRDWVPYRTIKICKDRTIIATSLKYNGYREFFRYSYNDSIERHNKLGGLIDQSVYSGELINKVLGKPDCEVFGECVSKLFPKVVTLGSNDMLTLTSLESLASFTAYKEAKGRSGPKQRRIDELVKIELAEPIFTSKPFLNNKVSALSKVADNICCLRTFMGDGEKFHEGGRVYISDDEVIACKKNFEGKYLNTTLSCNLFHWKFSLSYIEENCIKGTKLEYIQDICNICENEQKTQAIISFLYYPLVEKIYRYNKNTKDTVLKIITSYSPRQAINNILGKPDLSKKALNSMLGLNKYQLRVFVEDDMLDSLAGFKFIFSLPDTFYYNYEENINISFIDNKSFDKIYSMFKFLYNKKNSYQGIECMKRMYDAYGLEVLCNALEQIPTIMDMHDEYLMKNKMNYRNYSSAPFVLYSDYLRTVRLLGDKKNFRPYFKDYDELVRLHDAASLCYNLKKDAIKEKAFEAVLGRWDKFEFAPPEDDFAIVAPKKAAEIASEGILLHHCVKSYIDLVIAKRTNILFLRRKCDIDKPYFTIELDNNKVIQQVHGFGNSNLEPNSKELDFIKKWAKSKKLKLGSINKIR